MKKSFIYALLSAIALTGTVNLTSCSSTDDVAENPNYNPDKDEVLVDFAFNFSTNSSTTRMPATTVQENTAFRGIQNALLLTYKQSASHADGNYITASDVTCDKDFDLDQLLSAGALKPEGPQSRRVLEMSLPTGTNTLMFWGKAIKSSTTSDYNADSKEGSITFSPNKTLSDASFKLTPCLNETEKANLLLYEQIIESVLNKIVQSEATIANLTFAGKTLTDKTIKWSDYVDFQTSTVGEGDNQKTVVTLTPKTYDPSTYVESDATHASMSPLGLKIANLFVTLNTFGDSELRNGEGRMIEILVKDIYNVMAETRSASATTLEEKAAQEVAKKIQNNITSFFDVSSSSSTATDCSWKDVDADFITSCGLTASDFTVITSAPGDLGEFPDGIFRLPPGATILTYQALDGSTIKNEYHYMSTVPTYAMGAGDSFNPFNYMYPAELCYFGNSPIRVSNDTHEVTDYPDGASNWDDDDEWKANVHNNSVAWTKNGHVLSSTRSVAMQDNINYGTALLQTTIKYGDGVTLLNDNNKGLHPDEEPNTITVGDGSILELTGILVGGQAQEVGWNYLPVGENPFTTMIYDDQLPSSVIPTPNGKANYTLVWDNWNESKKDAKQNVVYVALQFKNKSGKDFWGQNNIIRNDATFYIIGTLDPDAKPSTYTGTDAAFAADKSAGVVWPTKYALPPYDTDGSGVKERRVFIQDYKTTANFVIGENSLKYALVSVPDLRSSQITLGLSVDLSWSAGLTFDNVVIGGE